MSIVVVAGALANKPRNGGNAWAVLSWALGLRALGFEVAFVEQIRRDCCIDAAGQPCPFEDSENLAFFRKTTEQLGLDGLSALICEDDERSFGLTPTDLADLGRSAKALVNITGHWNLAPLFDSVGCRVYIDFDPGYTQFWHAAGNAGTRLARHNYYYTIGENIGRSGCEIPVDGIAWRPIRQPVTLEDWPTYPSAGFDRFTTIASWRGAYGPVSHKGTTFGLKVHEFRKFLEMPRQTSLAFEIALDIHPADLKDRNALLEQGWNIVDPHRSTGGLDEFRDYVSASGAEFSAAQGVYVATESGWFSDRTVRYLASGRPALVQDTGFSRNLPVGEGLIPFRTLAEAVEGAERIARDPACHAQAARAIAESHFDSQHVLSRFCEEIGLHPQPRKGKGATR